MRLLLASSSESRCLNQELTETGNEWSKSLRLNDRLPWDCWLGCWVPVEEEEETPPAANEEYEDLLGKMGLMLDEESAALFWWSSVTAGGSEPKKMDESPLPPRDGGLLRLIRSFVCVVPVAEHKTPSSSESKWRNSIGSSLDGSVASSAAQLQAPCWCSILSPRVNHERRWWPLPTARLVLANFYWNQKNWKRNKKKTLKNIERKNWSTHTLQCHCSLNRSFFTYNEMLVSSSLFFCLVDTTFV